MRELLGIVSEEVLDEMIEAAATASAERALSLVHQVIAERQNLSILLPGSDSATCAICWWRASAGAGFADLVAAPADERPRLERQAALFSEEDLTRFFQILLSTQ